MTIEAKTDLTPQQQAAIQFAAKEVPVLEQALTSEDLTEMGIIPIRSSFLVKDALSYNFPEVNNDKIEICHIPPGNPENGQLIEVSRSAWENGHDLHNKHNQDFVAKDKDGDGDIDDEDCQKVEPKQTKTAKPTNKPTAKPTDAITPRPTNEKPTTTSTPKEVKPTPSATPKKQEPTATPKPTSTYRTTQTARPSATATLKTKINEFKTKVESRFNRGRVIYLPYIGNEGTKGIEADSIEELNYKLAGRTLRPNPTQTFGPYPAPDATLAPYSAPKATVEAYPAPQKPVVDIRPIENGALKSMHSGDIHKQSRREYSVAVSANRH